MRRRLLIFLTVVAALLSYTAYKLHESLDVTFVNVLPFMIPLFFLMFGSMIFSRMHEPLNNQRWFQLFSSFGTVFIGLWGSYVIFSLVTDILKLVVSGINIDHYTLPLSFVIVIFGFFEVLRGPVVKSIQIPRKNISADLHQFKIVQISDLHIGASIRETYVNKVISKTNELNADLVVITGDLIDGKPSSIQHVIDRLKELKAKHGVYYVVGNHEYYWGIESVLSSLSQTGMTILLNENKIIDIKGTKLLISGITDPAAHSMQPSRPPDIVKASETTLAPDFKILLAHQPSIYPEAEKLNYDLQLSGHTHAGQFFPFSLFIGFFHKYSRGLYLHNDMHLYVNPGTGYWGPANRFGIPAEITLLTLAKN